MSTTCRLLTAFIFSTILTGIAASPGHLARQETDIQFPANPVNWLNTPPINIQVLAGKAAVLYYFEES